MQFELNSDYLVQLKNAIVQNDAAFIKSQLNELYEVDIALILNQLEVDEANFIYDLLDEEQAADVLLEMEEEKREALLATFSTKEIAEQLDNMDSDDAADVINELPDYRILKTLNRQATLLIY
jgi:magnesium transporter